jgi:alpha-L-fucosidase
MHPQFKEAVTKYKPSVIFSDGEWDLTDKQWRSEELLAWLYNDSPVKNEVLVDDRWGSNTRGKHGDYFTSEYGAGMSSEVLWEESRGMGQSYGYNRMETLSDYKSGEELLIILIDIVSRGGNLLLDIGPTKDGRIPVIMEERLMQMGKWLEQNGDAIYNTRTYFYSKDWSEGVKPEFDDNHYMSDYDINKLVIKRNDDTAYVKGFYTSSEDIIYYIAASKMDEYVIKLDDEVETAELLGQPGNVMVKQKANIVFIKTEGACDDYFPLVFKLVIK